MKKSILLLSCAMLLVGCNFNNGVKTLTEKDAVALSDTLTTSLQMAYNNEAIVGYSVAIVNQEGLLYSNGFGFADIAHTKPYKASTIQNIASISKTLLGVSLLKAQELGHLNLNDPINKYLPFEVVNPTYPDTPILIKDLAYHTSSITDLDAIYGKSYVLVSHGHADNEGVYNYFNTPDKYTTLTDFMQSALTTNGKWYTKESFLQVKPGEQREYSNIAAALCALVIESAVKQDYRDFTKQYILKPLQMVSSGWSAQDINDSNRSRLFASKEMMIAQYNLITYADGGFLTTSNDLGLFLSELIKGYDGNGVLLTKQSYQQLFDKQKFTVDGKTEEYGLFMEFRPAFLGVNNEMIGHNGSDPGVFTAMYFNPKTKIGKIVLVNTDTDFTEAVWPEIETIWKATADYEKAFDVYAK